MDTSKPGPRLNAVIMKALKEFSEKNKGQVNLDSLSTRIALASALTSDEVKDAFARNAANEAKKELNLDGLQC